jgi:hypothetical protein
MYRGNEDDKDLTVCIDCPTGYYSGETGQPFCKACDAGMYASRAKSLSCLECPIGYHQKEKLMPSCDRCKKGKFADEQSTSECTSCPAQSTTELVGADSDSACVCDRGSYAKRTETESTLLCVPCPPRSVTLASGAQNISACVCQDGFWKPKGGKECLACPIHAACVQGKSPQTIRGYWRVPWRKEVNTSKITDEFLPPRLQCLEKTACLGAIDTASTITTTTDNKEIILTNSTLNNSVEGCAKFYNPPLCVSFI